MMTSTIRRHFPRGRFFAHMLGVAALGLVPHAASAAASEIRLSRLTSPEVAALVKAGTDSIIIPVGGTEQSGPYVVLGKHNIRVRALTGMIARKLGHVLVAPVIAYVPEGAIRQPTAHMRFTGTISVPAAAFRAVLIGAARSFARHGFRNIIILGDHGGYQNDLRMVVAALNRRWAQRKDHPRALMVPQYYGTTQTTFVKTLREHGLSPAEIGTHAGVDDTSLLMAVAPSAVRSAHLADSPPPGPAQGVYGDPRKSSAALGEIGVEEIVSATVAALRKDLATPLAAR
ncbi:MAG: creatininase family protein [Hyphomicrobiales bacterium]|nr:creatininase family protein [Hyphomicrobiales bacterium]